MGKRVNTAKWIESKKMWKINVQKDGIRKSFYSSKQGRTGQREANEKADEWLDKSVYSNLKIDDLWSEFLKEKQINSSFSNYRQIESLGRLYVLPIIKNRKISELTEQDLQECINFLWDNGKKENKMPSRKYLNNLKGTLQNFTKFCRKVNATSLFPENLYIPFQAEVKPKKILNKDEINILFTSSLTCYKGKIVEDPLINAYRFQVATGLRPGELIALKWEDIENNQIFLKRSINSHGEFTNGKNKNAKRSFYLKEMDLKILEHQKKISKSEYIFDIPVLTTLKNCQKYYFDFWKRYQKYNGITPISPYELRHTFISIIQNLPESEIKKIVGHSKNMDTFGVYAHDFNDNKKNTSIKIDKIFNDILDSSEILQ